MLCPKCGNDNPANSRFCNTCGSPIEETSSNELVSSESIEVSETTESSVPETTTPKTERDEQSNPAPHTSTQAGVVSIPHGSLSENAANASNATVGSSNFDAASQNTQGHTAPNTNEQANTTQGIPTQDATVQGTAPQNATTQGTIPQNTASQGTTPAPRVYAKGCMGAAWEDITTTNGWFGKIILLGLLYIVPILNWIVSGYSMRWSRELILGKIAPMPKEIFMPRAFINGVFNIVIVAIVGIIAFVVSAILGVVPFFGTLLALAVSIFLSMFSGLATIRVAIADRLSVAFDIHQIWTVFKRQPGALFCAAVLPSLIVGAIICVIMLIIGLIAGTSVMSDIIRFSYYGGSGYGYMNAVDWGLIARIFMVALPAIAITYVISCFLGAFSEIWTFRALGHFAARYATDWMNDPMVNPALNPAANPADTANSNNI